MYNRNKYKGLVIIFSILLTLSTLFLLMMILGSVLTIQDAKEYGSSGYTEYTAIGEVDGDITMESLGNMYQGTADGGYNFYRINVPIFNSGTDNYTENDMYMMVEGTEYSDVQEYYGSDSSYLSDEYTQMVPAGQTGTIPYIVQIKEGVSQLSVTFYENSDDYFDEKNGTTVEIAVPN